VLAWMHEMICHLKIPGKGFLVKGLTFKEFFILLEDSQKLNVFQKFKNILIFLKNQKFSFLVKKHFGNAS
jgi:hypothetical protein